MIRAVTIDAHGVLLLPDPDAIRDILRAFSCEPDDETCWNAHYEMVRLLDRQVQPDWPTMNRSFAKVLGVGPSDQDVAGEDLAEKVYLGTSWIPAQGACAALAQLIAGGFGAAIVSNTVHGELAALMKRVELCSTDGEYLPVAAIIDSKFIGIEKPDPRPFRLALEALGASPANAIHVGDSLHSDVVGAIGVGMQVIHIDPLNLCDDHGHGHAPTFAAFVEELIQSG